MIRVELAELVCIYVVVFLAAILAVCAMEFEDFTPAGLPRCPRCGSLNEREKLKVY